MGELYNLDGVKMFVNTTALNGEVSRETILEFKQIGAIVSATYSGGNINHGCLVGIIEEDRLEFRYAQVGSDGRLDGGHSSCEISKLEDGRLKIVENFQWESREGSGTNIFEELE